MGLRRFTVPHKAYATTLIRKRKCDVISQARGLAIASSITAESQLALFVSMLQRVYFCSGIL
jgi:hypothetical protein